MDEGLGEGAVEAIYLNYKHQVVINYCVNYNVKKCSQIKDDFDDHASWAIQQNAHHPMERIHDFMQSH
jgi:hypothetical protein